VAVVLALFVTLVPAAIARGQAAVLSFTDGTQFASFDSNGDTLGWYFNPGEPVIVTHMGFWDADQDGLAGLHAVGIWDEDSQMLLASVIVKAGTDSPLTGEWRYEPIAPLPLAAGNKYVIGAYYNPGAPVDNYIANVTSVATSPEVVLTASARDELAGDPNPFTFPNVKGAANGRFGPNFLFILDADGDAVADADDNCPEVANPAQEDADTDDFGDACDDCPDDPAKTEPGDCGCGMADTDTDGDSVLDCDDQCADADDTLDANGNGTPDCLEPPPPGPQADPGCCAPGVFPTVGLLTPLVLAGWKMRRRHGARIPPQRGLGGGGQARGGD
jgi:hypothetical protein